MEETKSKHKIEDQITKEWEILRISSDFIFCKVMQDKDLISELIRMVLPELDFIELDVQPQKAIEIGMDVHGVRFDVFVTLADNRVVDIEMQMLNRGSLPKRLRFYSSIADTQMLEKGTLYSNLADSYVIIICDFDHFGKGRHQYTFTNICHEDNDIELNDGSTKIVLNARGTMDDVDPKLRAFLDYVAGHMPDDDYVKRLENAVVLARANKKWRREYMTLMMRDLENQEIGREEGQAILAKIISQLSAGIPADDIIKAGVPADTVELAVQCVNKVQMQAHL